MEDHIFKCSLGFTTAGGTSLTIRSKDGSIVHSLIPSVELLGMFESGTNVVYCLGQWDPKHEMVWLGKMIEESQWQT